MQGVLHQEIQMPTSSDAMAVQAGRPSSQRRAVKRSSADPTNPSNSGKPLGQLANLYEPEAPTDRFNRWEEEFEIAEPAKPARFWDTQAIVATAISLAVGTMIGVPLGHIIHANCP